MLVGESQDQIGTFFTAPEAAPEGAAADPAIQKATEDAMDALQVAKELDMQAEEAVIEEAPQYQLNAEEQSMRQRILRAGGGAFAQLREDAKRGAESVAQP